MPVKTTSRLAYAALEPDTQAVRILKALKKCKSGLTRQELCDKTGLPINTVCGRVNELITSGRVHVMTLRRGSMGRLCEVVGALV